MLFHKRNRLGALALALGLWGCGSSSPSATSAADQKETGFELRYQVQGADQATPERAAIDQSMQVMRTRAEKLALSHAAITYEGQHIVVKLAGENELSVADLRELFRVPARLDLRLVRHEGGFMPGLCESLSQDSKAGVMRIETATDAWQDGTGAHVKQCYLSASDRVAMLTPQEAEVEGCRWLGNAERTRCIVSGKAILVRYLEGRSDIKPEPGFELAFQSSESSTLDGQRGERYWRSYYLQSESNLSASAVSSVTLEDSPDYDEPVLRIALDEAGAARLASMTSDNLGRKLGIVLDGEVLSAPVIHSAITGGSFVLALEASSMKPETLAMALESGALAVPIKEVSASPY